MKITIDNIEHEISEELRDALVESLMNMSERRFIQYEDHTDYEMPVRFIIDGTKFDFGMPPVK